MTWTAVDSGGTADMFYFLPLSSFPNVYEHILPL